MRIHVRAYKYTHTHSTHCDVWSVCGCMRMCMCCIVTEYFMHFFTSGSIYLWSDDRTQTVVTKYNVIPGTASVFI